MFVAASLIASGRISPVRVRNLSPDGAMVEGADLPEKGAAVELVRAHLRVRGRVVRSAGRQCGLAFDEKVDPAAWMARLAPTHQQRIDAMVELARTDIASGIAPLEADAHAVAPPLTEQLAEVIDLIEEVERVLADDPELLSRHARPMQGIDKALQMLRRLARSA